LIHATTPIESIVLKVDKEDHIGIDKFIGHVKIGPQEYIVFVVHDIVKNKFSITLNKGQEIKLAKNNFYQIWDGIIMFIEHNPNEKASKVINREFIAKCMLVFAFPFLIGRFFDLQILIFYTLIAGLLLGWQIVKIESNLKGGNDVLPCKPSKIFDCNKIITSKGSKILKLLSMGDMVLIYFAFLLGSLVICDFKLFYTVFYVLSIASSPFILFSIYYQGIVEKKWCIHCLLVNAVLIVNISLSLLFIRLVFV
jgi:uncharacterized membrane protein